LLGSDGSEGPDDDDVEIGVAAAVGWWARSWSLLALMDLGGPTDNVSGVMVMVMMLVAAVVGVCV
jgi:hypothetical protein